MPKNKRSGDLTPLERNFFEPHDILSDPDCWIRYHAFATILEDRGSHDLAYAYRWMGTRQKHPYYRNRNNLKKRWWWYYFTDDTTLPETGRLDLFAIRSMWHSKATAGRMLTYESWTEAVSALSSFLWSCRCICPIVPPDITTEDWHATANTDWAATFGGRM